MNNTVKISIIMPVYNVEGDIRQCLDSILSQTLTEWEVLAVDDGSTDSSLSILQEYKEKDSRVRVFTQQNRGAGIARNTGIKFAKGRYIAFMDSDDYYPDNETLNRLYTAADENSALICGGSVGFLKDGEIKPGALAGVSYCFEEAGWQIYSQVQQDYYYQRFIFDRKMLIDNNIFFPYYKRYQDPPFFVRAMITAGRFYAIPEYSYTYRVGALATLTWTPERIYDRLEGVIEELQITRSAKLDILHPIVANRLRFAFDTAVANAKIIDPERILETYLRAKEIIDFSLIADVSLFDKIEDYWKNYTPAQEAEEETEKKDKSISVPAKAEITFGEYIKRKIKGGIRCCKEHGIAYTLKRAIKKIIGK